MRITLLFIFLLIGSSAFGQYSKIKYPNFTGESLYQVSHTKGWVIIEKAKGYLNSDHEVDFAVILQSGTHHFVSCKVSAKLLADEQRIILVLMSKNGQPTVTIQNNKFIARPDEGGMLCYLKPHISIKNHQLKILYQYTRASMRYYFEYKSHHLLLVRAFYAGASGGGYYSSDSINFKKR